MTKFFVLPIAAVIAAVLACGPGSAMAQQSAPSLTNCHTPGAAGGSGTDANETTGKATGNAQDVEKSAILPSAGGHQESAAPTVQRDGKSVEARTDCPDEPQSAKPKG